MELHQVSEYASTNHNTAGGGIARGERLELVDRAAVWVRGTLARFRVDPGIMLALL